MIFYKHRLLPIFCGFCALFIIGFAAAQAQTVATTLFAEGQVTALGQRQAQRALQQADPIFEHDQITTHSDGRAQLRFTDGGLVSLQPDTLFAVEEYLYQDDEQGSLVFGLLKGGLRTVTGAIGRHNHEQYELKTPVATLGIRGTEYIAVLNPPNTLRVHVGRGKVVLSNDHGTLEVPEGHSAIAIQGQSPALSDTPPNYLAAQPPFSADQPHFTNFQDQLMADHLRDFPEVTVEQLQLLANPEPELTPSLPDPIIPEPDPNIPIIPDYEPGSPEFCEAYYNDHELCW